MRLLHRERQPETEAREVDRTDPVRDDVPSTGDHETDDRQVVAQDRTLVREPDEPRVTSARAEMRDTRERGPQPMTVRERTWTFAPGQLVSFVAGAALVVIGVIAVLRAGVDGSLSRPTVDVLTYDHTAWLGIAEIGLGLLLMLAGSGAWGRPLSVLLGAATVIAGVLVNAEIDEMPEELGLEKNYGWALIALGAIVTLAAMALPVWRRRAIKEADVVDLRTSDGEPRIADAKHPHL